MKVKRRHRPMFELLFILLGLIALCVIPDRKIVGPYNRVLLPQQTIVGVHAGYLVVVNNLPYSEKGRIRWWEAHQQYLREHYPRSGDKNDFSFYIADIGKGFKRELPKENTCGFAWFIRPNERYCLDEITSEYRCLEKPFSRLHVWRRYDGTVGYDNSD